MKGRKLVLFMLVVSLVLANYSFVHGAEAIKLKFSNFFPATHRSATVFDGFCKEINKRSNGRVQIAYFVGGSLLTPTKTAAGVTTGIADIGLSHCSYTRGRFPVMEAMELPLGFPSSWIASHVANDYYNKFKPKEWNDYYPLVFSTGPSNVLYTLNKPVRTLEDLKGMKIRATGRIADIVKGMGASPIPMDIGDVYEAFRRGVLDGAMGGLDQMNGFKFGELLKYTTESWKVGSVYTFYVVMNRRKWDKLPPDVKTIFMEVAEEYKEKWAVAWNESDIEGRDFQKAHGGQFIPLSDEEAAKWRKATQPVIAEYKKDLIAKGYKEKEVDSWLSFIRERIEYWKNQEKIRKIPTAYKY